MNIESLEIPDIKLISPSVFSDDRGYFMETFNQRLFDKKLLVKFLPPSTKRFLHPRE